MKKLKLIYQISFFFVDLKREVRKNKFCFCWKRFSGEFQTIAAEHNWVMKNSRSNKTFPLIRRQYVTCWNIHTLSSCWKHTARKGCFTWCSNCKYLFYLSKWALKQNLLAHARINFLFKKKTNNSRKRSKENVCGWRWCNNMLLQKNFLKLIKAWM